MRRKDSINDAFAAVLQQERERAGITQMDLARRLRCHQSAISKIESGGRPVDLEQLALIAQALGVSPVELFGRAVKYAELGSSSAGRQSARGRSGRRIRASDDL